MSKRLLFLSFTAIIGLLTLAGSLNLWAIPLPADQPFVTGPLKPLYAVRPVYPPAAKADGIHGPVMLRATVEKDGSVSRVKALTGNPQLAAAAIEAVRQWRYPPMKKAAKTNMTLFFGLPKAGSPDDYVEPPIAIYKPDPSFLTDGDMWLAVTVEVDGTVSNVNVLNSLGNEVDEKVIQTVQTWTFLPAVKAGKPVPFTIKVEVSFKRQ